MTSVILVFSHLFCGPAGKIFVRILERVGKKWVSLRSAVRWPILRSRLDRGPITHIGSFLGRSIEMLNRPGSIVRIPKPNIFPVRGLPNNSSPHADRCAGSRDHMQGTKTRDIFGFCNLFLDRSKITLLELCMHV